MFARDLEQRVWIALLCSLLLGGATAGASWSQGVGNVTGVVTDEEGNPLAGAFVIVEGTAIAAITDPDGSYAVTGISPGERQLVFTYVSYRTERREIDIAADERLTVHVTLAVDFLNLERIVVTGSSNPRVKLESSVAITTTTIEEIDKEAPLSTSALLKVVPGFWVESSGGEVGGNVWARGIPQDGGFRYVAMYEDGMPVFESSALAFANIDNFYRVDESVDVMEAVRGGSAAIFASNSPGGLINFISKTGGEAPAGTLRFSVGDYSLFRTDFNYGGPIGENWRFNVGGFYRFDSGVRDPDFLADKGGQIRFNLTRLFDGGYIRFYLKGLNERNIFYLPIPLQDADDPKSIPGVNANFGTMTSLDAAEVRVATGDGTTRNLDLRDGVNPSLGSLGVEFYHELDAGWSLKNSTRYTDIDLNYNAIFSGAEPETADQFAARKLDEFNTEFGTAQTDFQYSFATSDEPISDLSSLNGNGLVLEYGWWNVQKELRSFTNVLELTKGFRTHDLTVGFYASTYRDTNFWYFNNILLEARNAPRLLNLEFTGDAGGPGAATQNGFTKYGSRYVRADNEVVVGAVYANDEWAINDRWRLDAGLRLEWAQYDGNTEVTEQRDLSDSNPLGDPGVDNLADSDVQWGTGRFLRYDHEFSDWAGSVGANHSVSEQLAVYGRVSKGFRQPLPQQWYVLPPGGTRIEQGESEEVRQVEAGVKMSTSKVGLFVALFYSQLDNVIFNDEVLDGDGNLVPRAGNADTETPGAEVEVVWQASPMWRLDGIMTLQRPEYRTFVEEIDGNVVDFSGNRVRRIPPIVARIKPTFKLSRFSAFLEWSYVAKRYSDDANTVELPDYNEIGMGFFYDLAKTSYALHVTNLFNEVGLTEGNPRSGQAVGNVDQAVYLARPILGRAARLMVTFRF